MTCNARSAGVAEAELGSAWTAEDGRPYATSRLDARHSRARLKGKCSYGCGRGRKPNFRNLPW